MSVDSWIRLWLCCTMISVPCYVGSKIFGTAEKDKLRSPFDEAMAKLKSSQVDNFLKLQPGQSLNQFMDSGLKFGTDPQQMEDDNVFLFNDLDNVKNGMIREVLEFRSRHLAMKNITIYLDNSFSSSTQIQDRAQEIEKLLSFVNQLFLPEKGASVIVDNSEVSKGILAQIVRKFTSTGREILGQHILEKSPEEESVLELNLMMSSLLFIDLDPKKSQEVINMIESLGLIAFHENLWISMTKRATGNIKNMCNKPTHYYNYAEQKSTPLGSAYIVEKVAGCRRTGVTMEEIQCSRNESSVIRQYDFNTETWTEERAEGERISFHEPIITKSGYLPSRPLMVVAIANSAPPWVMVEDMDLTASNYVACARDGMEGIRYSGSKEIVICAHGFTIDILRALRKRLNFNYKIIVSRDGFYGSYNQKHNNSSGIVREILEGTADIAIDLTETKERSQVLYFSKPYLISSFGFLYVQPDSFYDSGIFNPFHAQLWMALFALVVVVIAFICVLEWVSPFGAHELRDRSIDGQSTFSVIDGVNYVWGTYFTGEIIVEKPKSFSSRVTIIFISISAIAIISAYSGNLITYLIVLNETPPITGFLDEKLIGDNPKVKAASPANTAMSSYLNQHSNAKLRKLSSTMKLCNMMECVKQLKRREFDVLLYDIHSLHYMTTTDKDCSLKAVRVNIDSGIGIASFKSSTWKRRFDTAVMSIVHSGEADYKRSKWFDPPGCITKTKFYSLSLNRLKDLFIIVGATILIGFFLLLLEISWDRLRHMVKDLHHKRKHPT